jgi:hypothetical protein
MQRREFIAGLGGAAAGAAIGSAAVWTYAARAHRALHLKILRLQANTAAEKIASFIREIAGQITLTTQSQLPWAAPPPPTLPGFTIWAKDPQLDQRRFDASHLMRHVPAITEIVQFDVNGNERLRESRFGPADSRNLKISADDPEFVEAVDKNSVWDSANYFGPVYVFRRSNYYVNMWFAGTPRDAGVSVVKVSLRLIWEVVRQVKASEHVTAFVLDAQGRVIAHSDDLNLFQRDFSSLPELRCRRQASLAWSHVTTTAARCSSHMQDRTNALPRKSGEGCFEIAIGSGIHNNELQTQRACRRLQVRDDGLGSRRGRVRESAEHDSIGYQLAEQLRSFRCQLGL